MSGEDLYERYVEACAEEGIGLDEWALLEESDQRAWNRLAEGLEVGA